MDFGSGSIEIRRNTDNWGPYALDLSASLPTGVRVSSCDATVYVGKLKKTSTKSDFSTCASVIESGTIATSNQSIQFKTQYPGDIYKGEKCTIVFTVTLVTGAINSFYFYPVYVR